VKSLKYIGRCGKGSGFCFIAGKSPSYG